jgi:uncharacterized protein (DUF3084 family)
MIKRTHCKNGHLLDEANTYISPKSQKRSCKLCSAARVKARRQSEPGFRERATKNMQLWRAANKEHNNKLWTDLRKRKKAWLESQKIACIRCGESDPACLDFHHRNPNEKELTLSLAIARASLKRIQAEVVKCDVLCSNCHRKTHHSERLSWNKKEI